VGAGFRIKDPLTTRAPLTLHLRKEGDVSIPDNADELRRKFFTIIFGQYEGYICIALLPKSMKGMQEEFFLWPSQEDAMLRYIDGHSRTHNVYFCPQLLRGRKRSKEGVHSTPCAWADLDACHPDNLFVTPSIIIESSPGRWQAYWRFSGSDTVLPDDAEDLSRRIAYAHAADGADRSGWDLSQLLRVPFTYNFKHLLDDGGAALVRPTGGRGRYNLEDFNAYPDVEGYKRIAIPMPDIDPEIDGQQVLERRQDRMNPRIWQSFLMQPEGDWSKALWNLELMCFEAGFERDEIYVICRDAACNKYARDHRSQELLWKDVCRAWDRNESNIKLLSGETSEGVDVVLLTDAERERLSRSSDTFIERYTTWARSLGDAAPQYHQAGAFIALSALLAGVVRLPTSFGTIVPNLWFMILADTTLTRKSTAMDIAMDLVSEIDPDAMLATDGSLEGLMTSLAGRPGRPSVFLRDEFSGLLESMTKKDYMAGMAELLTKLYDGKTQKRLLRKEVTTVKDPVLIIFAGGIKNKITSLLTYEQVSSGFMPRFIFITAESDPKRLKPLGPPTEQIIDTKAAISDELEGLIKHYWRTDTLRVGADNINQPHRFEARLVPAAWRRYNQLEANLVDAGLNTERADILTPTYDRLAKSILKAAILLAASRQRGVEVIVEEIDIIRAISYGEQWRTHALQVIENVGKSINERMLDNIRKLVERKAGITRSQVMQHYHLDARQATALFDTLEQRGDIQLQRRGRTQVLLPLQTRRNAR
jgi:ribosomal protein S25